MGNVKGIPPLFYLQNEEGLKVEVQPRVLLEGKEYSPESLIGKIAKSLSNSEALFGDNALGNITIACYILLESMHRAGHAELANEISRNPIDLQKFGLACAIGIQAGLIMPDGLEIKQTVLQAEEDSIVS